MDEVEEEEEGSSHRFGARSARRVESIPRSPTQRARSDGGTGAGTGLVPVRYRDTTGTQGNKPLTADCADEAAAWL